MIIFFFSSSFLIQKVSNKKRSHHDLAWLISIDILFISPTSFQTSDPFLCFSRSHMVNIIYPFRNDFFPTKTSTLLFYHAVLTSRTSEIHKSLPFSECPQAAGFGFCDLALTSLFTVISYLTVTVDGQHNFFPSSSIRYGNSKVLRV